MIHRFPWLALVVAAVPGCSTGDAARRATAQIDTLPSGVVQVMSAEPTSWTDSSGEWRIEEVQRYGGSDGSPSELADAGSLAVDDLGRLYIADRKPTIIKVFDSTGKLVRMIGREGSGPGEFQVAFIAVRGVVLAVHDPQLGRTSVFDTSGAFIRGWTSSCCFWHEITIDRAGRIYIPTNVRSEKLQRSPATPYTRYTVDGKTVDTLLVPVREDGKEWRLSGKGRNGGTIGVVIGVPFSPETVHAFGRDSGFVYGWNGEYRFVMSPNGRDTTRLVGRAWVADPIPEELRLSRVEETVKDAIEMYDEATLRSMARLADIPTTAPAYVSLRVDGDGNVWARRLIGSDSTRTAFDVFDPTGAWLGPITVRPAVFDGWGHFFGRGVIYTRSEDQDGRPIVVRLRVSRSRLRRFRFPGHQVARCPMKFWALRVIAVE